MATHAGGGPTTPKELCAEIELFVDQFLPADAEIEPCREGKAIHDPIWGTSVFSPVEISILDTPLMQRLRGVHQTSLAYLIYPAANHTRLEHSLGVTVVSDKLCDALVADLEVQAKYPTAINVEQGTPDRLTVRLSALLHDCGHAFLSHIGERQLEDHPAIREIQSSDARYEKAKAHEVLSSLIVSSKRFTSFFDRLRALYPLDGRLDYVKLDEVAEFIVGHATPKRQFLADIINGAFDADKLDYLFRDAYFTGLRLALDIDRLLYAMSVAVVDKKWLLKPGPKSEDSRRKELTDLDEDCRLRLVVRASGAAALEQILFNKIQLTVGIYHHQKVRAADAMLTCFVERLTELGGQAAGLSLDNPIDFLRHTDWEWLYKASSGDAYLEQVTDRIKTRRLLKRALVVSRATADSGLDSLLRFQGDPEWPAVHSELREMVLAKLPAGHGLQPYDIVFDLPSQPSFREASQTPILLANRSLDTLETFFPTGAWLTTFFAAKWQGHVYCPDNAATRVAVAKAAREALAEHPDITLTLTDQAVELAHLNP